MYVRMLKRELKNRPRKLRPVRRCFLSTFALITCRSFIILNFICARRASQIQVRRLLYVKFKRQWKSTFITIFFNTKLGNMQHHMFLHKLLLKAKNLNVLLRLFHIASSSFSFVILHFIIMQTKN